MRVTKDWLRQYSTNGKGYNKQQIEALGLEYPPKKGWMDVIEGIEITKEKAAIFEDRAGKSIELLDIARKLTAAVDYPVYYTVPDGNGSFKGRFLKPEEVGTFPDE